MNPRRHAGRARNARPGLLFWKAAHENAREKSSQRELRPFLIIRTYCCPDYSVVKSNC